MSALLIEARLQGNVVELVWGQGRANQLLSLFWLRDHCQDTASQHPETKQRLLDTFQIPANISARAVMVTDGGRELRVQWADESHVSRFDAAFLAALRVDPDVLPAQHTLWDRDSIGNNPPQVSGAAFLADDAVLKDLLEKVARYGLCFVNGVAATPEATKQIATRIAYLRDTIFGAYWDFTANLEHKDTAYTSMAIGPHTDGTYSVDAPGYQMFHCLAADCTGGENVLIDGFKMAQILQRDHPDMFRVLTQVAIPGHYLDHERGIHLMARRPLFRLGASGELLQVTYNNYDRAPFVLPNEQQADFYRALSAFNTLCADQSLQYRRRLLPGSMLIFDNWRILHARDAYVGYRRLAGVYLNKEDFESRLRCLRIRAGERV